MTGRLKHKPATRRDRLDAARLQRAGQHGDTVLAHINPSEARLLDYLADQKIDAPRNPKTGLLSFGMSDGESGGFGGSSGNDSNPGGVGGGPAGGQTGGGIGGNTSDGTGGLGGGYGDFGYAGSANQRAAMALGDYYQNNYIGGMLDSPYAAKDTLTRFVQEYFNPSVKTPGRYGAPTAAGPGLFGSFLSQITPSVMGMPAFSVAMGIGGAMGRASSPATQAASAAEMSERGARNSGGREHWMDDPYAKQAFNKLQATGYADEGAGAKSGARTADLPQVAQVPPGYTMNPAGQLIPLPHGQGRPAYQDPVRNLLMDYIWSGRRGGGLLGW